MSDLTTVYANILRCLEFRGALITSERLDPPALARALQHDEHVVVRASRTGHPHAPDRDYVAILFAPGADAIARSSKFISTYKRVHAADDADVMLVTASPLTHHIVSAIAKATVDMPNQYIERALHATFMFTLPECAAWSPHEIADPAELARYREYHRGDDAWPKILATDPAAIWIGARPGDIVATTRPSATAGTMVQYLECV